MTILPRILRLALALLLAFVAGLAVSTPAVAQSYTQHNLVSDLPGVAPTTDANLVNPWGIVFPPKGPFWISDNNAGVSTLYDGNGNPFPVGSPLVVMIPPPTGGSGSGTPTGVVFNGTTDFVVSNGTASSQGVFLFATEDGTISGWAPQVDVTHALLAVDNSAPGGVDGFALGAVYKGLAIGNNGSGNFIYATNFRDGVVEMYDGKFSFVNSFTDPTITPDAANPGFAPFGIRNINGKRMSPLLCRTPSDTTTSRAQGAVLLMSSTSTVASSSGLPQVARSTRPGAWRWLQTTSESSLATCSWAISATGTSLASSSRATLSTVSFAVVRAIPSPLTAFGD